MLLISLPNMEPSMVWPAILVLSVEVILSTLFGSRYLPFEKNVLNEFVFNGSVLRPSSPVRRNCTSKVSFNCGYKLNSGFPTPRDMQSCVGASQVQHISGWSESLFTGHLNLTVHYHEVSQLNCMLSFSGLGAGDGLEQSRDVLVNLVKVLSGEPKWIKLIDATDLSDRT